MGTRRYIFTTLLAFSTFASTSWGETVYIKASAARLRKDISLEADDTIIGRIPQNRAVEILGRKTVPGKGTWLRVKSGGKVGWINAKITSASQTSAAASAPAPKVAPKPVAKVETKAKPESVEKPAAAKPPVAKVATPKPAAEKPVVTKPEAAKPDVAKTKDEKKKPNLPVVDRVKADGTEKCITELHEGNKEQDEILGPLKPGKVHQSPSGVSYSLNDQGRIVFTVTSLNKTILSSLVKGTGYPEEILTDAIKNGAIEFNGTICRKDGTTVAKLVGTGATGGRTGYLALIPEGKGFRAKGQIADAQVNETFSAR